MRKGLTEIIFILDRSGSMFPTIKDTIGGFNATIEKQKNIEGECLVSTVLFNEKSKVLHDRVNLQSIETLTTKEYEVHGCTALLDAIGDAIHHIKNVHKYIREEDKPEKTLFIITTDGLENASRKYSYERIKEMIQEKQKEGWEFIFLGANIDSYGEGRKFGISDEYVCNYSQDEEGISKQYSKISKAMCQIRTNGKVDDSWKD